MRLSVCIPTRNYGPFIARALDSVLDQGEEGIEIVILDSGSQDETRDIVMAYKDRGAPIAYHYEDKAEGIDRAIAKVVSYAGAPYCWLLSADDAFAPGALKTILNHAEAGQDVLLCNRYWCDETLSIKRPDLWRPVQENDETVSFSDPAALRRYCEGAVSLGALFSFMSCIGFRKSLWDAAETGDTYLGTHYAHVPRLTAMCRDGRGLGYLADPLILCRGGNDSFRSDGLLARMLIDLRGYHRFGRDLFPADPATRHGFYRVLRREHPLRRWVKAFWLCRAPERRKEALRYLPDFGYGPARTALLRAIDTVKRVGGR